MDDETLLEKGRRTIEEYAIEAERKRAALRAVLAELDRLTFDLQYMSADRDEWREHAEYLQSKLDSIEEAAALGEMDLEAYAVLDEKAKRRGAP